MAAHILLFYAVKNKPVIAVAAACIFSLLPIIQLINTPLAFRIWLLDLQQKPLNSVLYIAFSILFGMFISLYSFTRNMCLDCKSEKSTRMGFVGSVIGLMFGICPACFSFIGILLPLGLILFLTYYSPIFTVISISIVFFSIYKLGGFKTLNAVSVLESRKTTTAHTEKRRDD
ncbi:hypothetical protein HRbin02_00949 [Candidatus Calditenuaceae archaeon HR02]|nr:hypothetical protein HRbin02_00949 [Candidatus Calditenuaceae archaeon HR02]